MAEEEFRLLGSALALGRFTASELGRAAGVNSSTVASWLRRNAQFVIQEGKLPSPKGLGRPRNIWRIRDGAASEIRALLDNLYPSAVRSLATDLRAARYLDNLDHAEVHVAAWRAASRSGDTEAAEQDQAAARSWIRIAWEDFAALEAAGVAIPEAHLQRLAELEREVGAGDLTQTRVLREVAAWLARRLARMSSERGVSHGFAAHVLRLRAQVRTTTDRVALTAAALAAPVWSDEGLAEDCGVEQEVLRRCATLADLVPPNQRLREVSVALDQRPNYGFSIDPEEGQAIVLGLVVRPRASREREIRDWLSHLPLSNDWQQELAPAVVRGLVDAPGIKLSALLQQLAEPLDLVLNAPRESNSRPGAIRQQAFDYSRRVLESHHNLMRGGGSDVDLKQVVESWTWRPPHQSSATGEAVL